MANNYLDLYKLVCKSTGVVSDFCTYEDLQNIKSYDKDIKKHYDIYVLTMQNCNKYLDLDKQ